MTESTTAATGVEIVADFEITGWDETTYHEEPDDGPKLTRVTVHNTFRGGIEGTSTTELLTAQGDDGRGYLASEHFTGTIDAGHGTVVFQHGGIDDNGALRSFGHIVPGTGTAGLAGLRGEITYVHDETGAKAVLRLASDDQR
jgi:Protein of unknown function (DUF3224)